MSIYFNTPKEPYGEFSNRAAFGIEMDGAWWPTVEHYYQAQKFDDANYREKIRCAPNPKSATLLGRSYSLPVREDWADVKESIMLRAVKRKFQTHAEPYELLMSTGDESIYENAPHDFDLEHADPNHLGAILVEVRAALRKRV